MIAKDKIFREYDIRGVVGRDFDSDFSKELGKVYALRVKKTCQKPLGAKVAVGRDCRLSGEELSNSLIEGILAQGVDVLNCGVGPSPQLYYAVFQRNLDGGIQITGSHNPVDENGFKIMVGRKTLHGKIIQTLKSDILSENKAPPGNYGKLEEIDIRSPYIEELIKRSKPYVNTKRRIRVVVDAGNGVGGLVGPEVLRGLGCEVVELYTEPDGTFPNHHPDPTVLDNLTDLRAAVCAENADLGIAWDGDGDRIGVVDEFGEQVSGDKLIWLYGKQLLTEVDEPIIIADVKCSDVLFSELAKAGARAVMWKTGHSLLKSRLEELHGQLAGELGGHMFFSHRFFGFDDALHASARLIEIVSKTDLPFSRLFETLPKMVSTPELRIDCPEEIKFAVVERAKQSFNEYPINTLDGVRITFPSGWGLVRASNTQPKLVMRFEADKKNSLEHYRLLVEERVSCLIKELS